VNREEVDFTIADSNEFALQRHTQPELRVALNLKKNNALAWAFRKTDSRRLLEFADNYLLEAEREGMIAQINERYYGHAGALDYVDTRTFIEHIETRLPQFREMFEEAGRNNNVDWRLLAAIGYQESHWQPRAISSTGVRGLMMLTRTTASELNIKNRLDPANSIRGGAEYYRKQWKRLPETVREPDRSWFALAAYNVGFNHLKDAWQITQWQGNDPTQWANVSKSLPLLANKLWYPHLSHGYARGWEPVIYVNNIRSYYDIMTALIEKEPLPQMVHNTPINISDAP
jgi:membrane-bound lytic murein transglycosylase F